VIGYLLERVGEDVYGLEIIRARGVKSGTLYPLLDRLEAAGVLESVWEDLNPTEEGRPRRRIYHLTGIGQTWASATLLEYVPGAPWAIA
jgi:PadR family transcriptional regulator, regulatory protein PadR